MPLVPTSFDAYFAYSAANPRTSSSVFSNLVLPLTAEEYNASIAAASSRLRAPQPAISAPTIQNALFSRFMIELQEGFNILCFGFGSKRQLLNHFATQFCSKKGHVVVANGFLPDFAIKDLFTQIDNIPEVQDLGMTSLTPEKQAQILSSHFSEKGNSHLYIVIHNIDSPVMRAPRVKSILSLLALTPNIHIIASIDHINSPLIWSSSECISRKSTSFGGATTPRGFSWIYHDLTSLAPYDFELANIDRTSLTSAHGGGSRKRVGFTSNLASTLNPALPGGGTTNISETAALHILASVTQKAQKLFTLLANRQLEAIEDGPGTEKEGQGVDLQATAIGYDALFNLARGDFVATNDTALRALLGEFRDHGLIVSAQGGSGSGGEVLWIPLRKERLTSVLQKLQTQT